MEELILARSWNRWSDFIKQFKLLERKKEFFLKIIDWLWEVRGGGKLCKSLVKCFVITPWIVCSTSACSASLIFISFRCFSIWPRSRCNTWKSDVVEFDAESSLTGTVGVTVLSAFSSPLAPSVFCNRRFSSCRLLTNVTKSFDSARHCSSINSSSYKHQTNK